MWHEQRQMPSGGIGIAPVSLQCEQTGNGRQEPLRLVPPGLPLIRVGTRPVPELASSNQRPPRRLDAEDTAGSRSLRVTDPLSWFNLDLVLIMRQLRVVSTASEALTRSLDILDVLPSQVICISSYGRGFDALPCVSGL